MRPPRLLLVVPLLLALILPAVAETSTDHPPVPIKRVPPDYTQAMRENRPKGDVVIDLVVDQQGAVTNPIVQTSLSPEADRAALECVRQWTFEPAVKNGRAVKTRMRIPIRFK